MLAMAWLMDDSTKEKASARGMPIENNGMYAIGRLGVLGDCPVDNVIGAAYFWNPDTMRQMVETGRAAMSPLEGARHYAEICQEYGAQHLAGLDGVERLGELCEKVVDNASPLGVPTFVGWRDQQRPAESGPAKTFQLAQCLRELRFGRHAVAVQAAGMGPLEAILSGPAGAWNAEFFGWPKPYPDIADLAADFDILTDTERSEIRDLAKAARAHASA